MSSFESGRALSEKVRGFFSSKPHSTEIPQDTDVEPIDPWTNLERLHDTGEETIVFLRHKLDQEGYHVLERFVNKPAPSMYEPA